MPNMSVQQVIDSLPDLSRKKPIPPSNEFLVQSEMSAMLNMIRKELTLLNQAVAYNSQDSSIVEAINSLEASLSSIDTDSIVSGLNDIKSKIPNEIEPPIIQAPNVTVNIPTEELKAILEAIKALRLDSKESVSVTNLSEITKSINDLKPFLVNIESTVSDSKMQLPDKISLNDDAVSLLKNLNKIDTDPKKPIAVRLSDGKEFYKSIGSLDSGIRAMTGSSGNNFLTPTGSPTKANLDQNGVLKVGQDNYTVKIEYSGSNPIYVGKTVPGNAVSASTWQIQKLTYSGSNVTDVQWASGSLNFTHVWNDRAGYTYS